MNVKIFLAKILYNKKFFDFSKIYGQHKTHVQIKFLKILFESDNFLSNMIFGQTPDVEVNYMTLVSYAYREVGGGLLVLSFRGDLNSSLNSLDLDFGL